MKELIVGHRINVNLDKESYKKLHRICWNRINRDGDRHLKREVVMDALEMLYEEEIGCD